MSSLTDFVMFLGFHNESNTTKILNTLHHIKLKVITEKEIISKIKGKPITKLCSELFYAKSVVSVDAPSVKYVGKDVFRACSQLTTINLPNVETIEDGAFTSANAITTLDFPKLKSVGPSCFESCTGLLRVNAPVIENISDYAFNGCQVLNTISDMQYVTSIGTKAFYRCRKLASPINLPLVTELGAYTFADCSTIPSINIPLVTNIGTQALYNTSQLTEVSLPSIETIGNKFLGNSNATSLTLGGPSKPITTTDNFSTEALSGWSTPATVTIYVSDPSNPPSLNGSPWGKLNATIIYEQA